MTGGNPSFRKERWAAVSIVVLALLVYTNSFPGAFILDDVAIVEKNPLVAAGSLRDIFTSDYWGMNVNTGLYRPLTILSFRINRVLFGEGILSYHFINVFLHALAALLVFHFLRVATPSLPIRWTASAIFAVHPLHTEVVNVVVGRSELLVAVFLLSALILLAKEGKGRAVAAMILYVGALLAKENALCFPLLLILVDVWVMGNIRTVIRRRWPAYGIVVVISAVWLWFRGVGISRGVLLEVVAPRDNPLTHMHFLARILSALNLQLHYLKKMLFPVDLRGIYTASSLDIITSPFSYKGAAVVLIVAALSLLAAIAWWKRQPFGLGVGLFAASFLVTSNLFFTIGVAFAERLAFLPSLGFCLAFASLMVPMVRGRIKSVLLGASVFVMVVAGYMGLTLKRNAVYASPVAYWEKTVQVDPLNTRAWQFLAKNYAGLGAGDKAEIAFQKALAADPGNEDALVDYGTFLVYRGEAEKAVDVFLMAAAVSSRPLLTAFYGLATAYIDLHQPEDALYWLDRTAPAYEVLPRYWEARGMVLELMGRMEEAGSAYGWAESLKNHERD